MNAADAPTSTAGLEEELAACLTSGGGQVQIPAGLRPSDPDRFARLLRIVGPIARAGSRAGLQTIVGPRLVELVPIRDRQIDGGTDPT